MVRVSWLIAHLLLSLPVEYKLVGTASEDVSLASLTGTSAHLEFRRWEAPGGRALHLAYWQPWPARDGGPMHAVAEWSAVVAGQPVRVYETDYFMGRKQRVLVMYLRVAAPEAQVSLYATGLTRAAFLTLLAHVQLKP
jgi:hypothetical protein